MKLGPVIRQLRQRKGWTQDELAHQAGTTAASVSRIEAGKYRPGPELLGSLAFVLDVKVYELIALSEGVSPPALKQGFDPDEETIIRYYRKMAPDERELFKALGASLCKVRRAKAAPLNTK